jgi:hypothetical protein
VTEENASCQVIQSLRLHSAQKTAAQALTKIKKQVVVSFTFSFQFFTRLAAVFA